MKQRFIPLFLTVALLIMATFTEVQGQDNLQRVIDDQIISLRVYRSGLADIIKYTSSNPGIFTYGDVKTNLPDRKTKETIWQTWQDILDYYIALESLRQYHKDFLSVEDRDLKISSFLIYYSSFLIQYRSALEFIDLMESNALADKLLNESVPELGLPGGQYASFKFRFLNVKIATEFATLEIAGKALFNDEKHPSLRRRMDVDRNFVWEMGKGKGEFHTLKNAVTILKDTGFKAWLPIQTSVAQTMGNIRVRRPAQYLITQEQIQNLASILQPGDILLQRREWYMSNVGLPGFWTHAALYVGNPDERRIFFDDDETQTWVKGHLKTDSDFEKLLKARTSDAYRKSSELAGKGYAPRVLEAIAPGVVFTALEKSAAADSLAVLRPRLSKREIAEALLRGFKYSGRPYDYNFDFATDDKLVCSELVYKSYEPSDTYKGIKFPLEEKLGRLLTPPNLIAGMFVKELGSENQQLDFVYFLDGHEGAGKAVEASMQEFLVSWKRPKWHILTQADLGEKAP